MSPSVGKITDAWCTRCNLLLAHTVEAKVGDTIARVACNTCRAKHAYRAGPPGTTTSVRKPTKDLAAGSSKAGLARASHYGTLIQGRDVAAAKVYSTKSAFSVSDLVKHPSFGVGVVVAIKSGGKMEVLFANGPKVLVFGR